MFSQYGVSYVEIPIACVSIGIRGRWCDHYQRVLILTVRITGGKVDCDKRIKEERIKELEWVLLTIYGNGDPSLRWEWELENDPNLIEIQKRISDLKEELK